MIHPTANISTHPDPLADQSLFTQRRAAIDEVATTRAKVIRCGLFGTYLFRPNPLRPDTEELRQSWHAEMRIQLQGLTRACALLEGRDPEAAFPEQICQWIARCGQQCVDEVAILRDMKARTERLIDAAFGEPARFERLLIDHAIFGRGEFFPAISRLCDAFWSDLDQQRHDEIERARVTGTAIGMTLERLEHIGRHVRLVSVNASVESARVGEAGWGLGVIAQEFKSLAEEIQKLANSARDDIEGLTQQAEKDPRFAKISAEAAIPQ